MANPFVPFLVVGLGEAALATQTPWWVALPLGWASAGTLWTALAYALARPRMLGKLDAPAIAAVLLAPVLRGARIAAVVVRKIDQRLLGPGGSERIEVAPGLWVGGWPRRGAGDLAQLDLTAELPQRGTALRYACIPMLDGAPMSDADFHAGVAQVLAWRAEGLPVLVHCAYGHGRSVAVLVGAMVAEGLAPDWATAHAHVLAVRPRAKMTAAQRAVVARCTTGSPDVLRSGQRA